VEGARRSMRFEETDHTEMVEIYLTNIKII
jgi:hypothetical protein